MRKKKRFARVQRNQQNLPPTGTEILSSVNPAPGILKEMGKGCNWRKLQDVEKKKEE